ncbi:MAG: carboxypeptidase-like regulatory domain-containing protein [Ferruginibacter sp.]
MLFNHLKSVCFFIAAILTTNFLFAQSGGYWIRGKVLQTENQAPLAGASVFAENTTLGTYTDSSGSFTLLLPAGGYTLSASYTGFQTAIQRVSGSDHGPLTFLLSIREKTLQEVAVVSTGEVKNGWEKYGKQFLEGFIGRSSNSEHCQITNPEQVRFFYSKRKNRLKVMANEPVRIENRALGYVIRCELDSFVLDIHSGESMYTGTMVFEEMTDSTGAMRAQWDSSRLYTYRGSVLEFMRAFYQQQLAANGFEVGRIESKGGKAVFVREQKPYEWLNVHSDSATGVIRFSMNQSELAVHYFLEGPDEAYLKQVPGKSPDYQLSKILLKPGMEYTIEQNGYYYDQQEIILDDYWSWCKLADLLPYDYRPSQ